MAGQVLGVLASVALVSIAHCQEALIFSIEYIIYLLLVLLVSSLQGPDLLLTLHSTGVRSYNLV